MKLKKLILCISLFSIILISSCVSSIKPTDVCEFNIPVSQLYANEDFNYVDFFDFSIDIARENNFQPVWEYDKDRELIVFGNSKIVSMPGLKMVVYMWVENPSSGSVDNICINYQLLPVRESAISHGIAKEAMFNFKNELEQKYSERIEDMKRIYKKYQTN
jgi:hypothetical protein